MRDFVLNSAMALGRNADFTARSCSLISHVPKQCILVLVDWKDWKTHQLHLNLQL